MLTKKEKEIVKKAIEMLETGDENYSCLALSRAEHGGCRATALTKKYEDFYDIGIWYRGGPWAQQLYRRYADDPYDTLVANGFPGYSPVLREFRIMLLLNFLEGANHV